MKFLAYIAVVLVAVCGILLELDWLTKPKTETKTPIQTAGTVVPSLTPRVVAKAEGPNADLSPVYPKTEAAAPVQQAEAVFSPVQPPVQPFGQNTPSLTTPAAAETTGAAPAAAATTRPPETAAAVTVTVQPASTAQPVSTAAKNQCDVQGCTAAYKSFRASDCTFQPLDGARQICAKPPQASQRVASEPRAPSAETRKPDNKLNKEAELREVERAVRRLTNERVANDDVMLDEPGGMIVIRRR